MIRSEQKPFEEILGSLEGDESVFILGCGGCAAACGSGGEPEVLDMRARLEGQGKSVSGHAVVDFLCQKALVISRLGARRAELEAADSLLVLTCGVGVQAVAAVVARPVHPGCNTVSLGGAKGEWQGAERCLECGDCLLDATGGLCPLTLCSKGLTNGACGGAKRGMCEVSEHRPCGWELIYKRLASTGRLEKLRTFVPPKAYDRMRPRAEWLATSVWDIEAHAPPADGAERR
ncbi:MAG: methylenetetrahydrofolate reductase C-terminal domain-containing protein [Deltaproteobacteria bacterium]|nr:methylenetetrahydrofolate reductase C-terminal domain-containing protein [Deltaproteobacteria bacterium]